ncbi:hypothetical protein KY284_032019 [Solanum tuberosum]|nr:hypothetical protein KY284_032019 [Solanum tuberosum]
MENGDGTNGKRIRAEDVICKLKDDGDFDRLRLKIVRRMKENVRRLKLDNTYEQNEKTMICGM